MGRKTEEKIEKMEVVQTVTKENGKILVGGRVRIECKSSIGSVRFLGVWDLAMWSEPRAPGLPHMSG